MKYSQFTTRFAPSPTGHLHLGHAYAALYAARAAKAESGRLLLRVEDIDQTRCRTAFEAAIFEDLAWLGLSWEKPVRRQSEHFGEYTAALERLREKELVYRCFKTRKEIVDEIARAPHLRVDGPDGPAYIGAPLAALEERSLIAEGAPFAWRLSIERVREYLGARYQRLSFCEEMQSGPIERQATPAIFGDAVLARKDSGTSYHLASVHDDALQGVTHVIRGTDLRAAAHLHCLLQALFDYPTPVYRHHRLITGDDGRRLAKRDSAATLKSMRDSNISPQEVRSQLGFD